MTEVKQLNSIWYQILPFLGLIDSLYLLNIHSNPSVCTVRETPLGIPLDCGSVAQSQYSEILGIPLAILGLLYYLILLLIVNFEPNLPTLPISSLQLIAVVVSFGFLFTLWLVYLQLFVIELICIYCMVSAILTTSLFIITYYFMFLGSE